MNINNKNNMYGIITLGKEGEKGDAMNIKEYTPLVD